MITNILTYMYDGYEYDMDNPLLYTDPKNFNAALDEDGYGDMGMKTMSSNDLGVIGHEPELDVENARTYTEVGQFISENGANYTDLRKGMCACKSE